MGIQMVLIYEKTASRNMGPLMPYVMAADEG